MIYFYRIIYSLVRILFFILKPALNPKMQAWLKLRSQKIQTTKTYTNAYWFHASSGEIEYCKSVIRLLKIQQPRAQIVVTYSSPSAERLFYNVTEYVDQFIALPWDQPAAINTLIDYINPRVLIFSKTDLWPELITQIKKRNIKAGVISFNPTFNFLNTYFLPQLDFISCIDEDIKTKLMKIADFKNISADGDTRFDQVFHRLEQPSKMDVITDLKLLICGSTWPEDESVLFDAFAQIIRNGFKIILSPHEIAPANIERVQKELQKRGFSFQHLANQPNPNAIKLEKDILIIDKIGFLADAYRSADVAFVGGSFKDKIHSVMEPLCCGLPVITGPHYRNNLEAVKYQNRYVFTVQNAAELVNAVEKVVSIPKKEVSVEMSKNKKASEKVLKLFTL